MQYEPDRAGVAALLKSQDMRRFVQEGAELAQAMARAKYPRDTGDLRRDIRINTEIVGDRWQANVTAYNAAALPIEYGNVRTKIARHILQNIAEDLSRRR
ncbi:HK97 gp10 family phage protein [Rhodococcus rhodochrous]|uniref:HK97 gp10 family phage protein n=1 Tax=Rhodococcus rhodochrous TaxID=1829 RepID=UPI00132E73D3|nr:HK97 gp10 family phage protein [Rhodococcus rhodochrous]QHG80581.1 HK97 gp10 family phage protein [Rhodococcus rhodochrous]